MGLIGVTRACACTYRLRRLTVTTLIAEDVYPPLFSRIKSHGMVEVIATLLLPASYSEAPLREYNQRAPTIVGLGPSSAPARTSTEQSR